VIDLCDCCQERPVLITDGAVDLCARCAADVLERRLIEEIDRAFTKEASPG
jgi:hypothetical protein